ncbi:hypothetical protein [Desulfovibrio sp. JC022]|uniref:hypothetical protein n=1 Tax=Desulfovibrio sp. JC022 TaxID=2593642 RepID=UPI0013D36606|nr:hypothetical protein [Desulfovibrio sp. JC022]NDV24431.1 hypothetical protein [Desulfovibrio sp. JC022]
MTTEKKKFESITDNFMQKLDELEEMERPDPSRVLSMLSLREEIDYLLADKEKNEAEIALLTSYIDELETQLKKRGLKEPAMKDWDQKMPQIVDGLFKLFYVWLRIHQKHNKKAIDEFTGMKRPKEPFLKPKTTRKQIKNMRIRGLTDEQVKYITGLSKPTRDALRKAIANCQYEPIMMRQKN